MTVHDPDASVVSASELTLDKFIDTETVNSVKRLAVPTGAAQTVLLTGATGYLGRFLCLEWLQRLARSGGKLICITRASDSAAARRRLGEAFDHGDPDLTKLFATLAETTLTFWLGTSMSRTSGWMTPRGIGWPTVST